MWDTSEWLSQNSIPGRILHALMGYNERPSVLQVIVYLATLAAMAVLMRIAAPPRPALRTTSNRTV
jgi:high-affinity iron transporter